MFHDVRLQEDVEQGARGGPGFKTTIIGVGSGNEQRNKEWQLARARWDISYGITGGAQFGGVLAFFYARNGRAYGFRFKDWSDYSVTGQVLGDGDGSNTDFQLIKTYGDVANTYIRVITRPVSGTLTVYVDAVEQTEGVDYTLGSRGVVQFSSPPPMGDEVTADFEFDVPVRFDVDELELDVTRSDTASYRSIEIIEIRE